VVQPQRSEITNAASPSPGSGQTEREETLSSVLGELARTLSTDFPVQGILDHFVKRIVEVLPITSAGVTLISAGVAPHYVAASDDSALRFEQLQSNIGEGPCVRAYETGQPVVVPDLRVEQRFPKFAPAAVTAGLGAVFTFPLHDGDGRLGALDLYRDSPGELDARDMEAAQTLADVAAAYLLNAQARDQLVAAFELLQSNTLHDPLTGLVNRVLLQDRIEHAAHVAKGSDNVAAILFVNIDGFRLINETHGRQLGDQLLRAIAERLGGVIDSADTLARFADDKFVILCENIVSAVNVDGIAERVDAALLEPFALIGADRPVALTASIGVVFAGSASALSNDLVVKADKAMLAAKKDHAAPHQLIDLRVALDEHLVTSSEGQGTVSSMVTTLARQNS
jgi:diguanylate cyclase (GGDEF)-like protein